MNFSTGLCHLIHEYDLIMTSNVGMMSISFYVMMGGGGGGSPKSPRVAERKQNPVWVGLMVNVCQFWRRKKHLCSSRCWGNYCWLRNWGLPFGHLVNNTASCFKTLKGDRVSFLFFIMRKDKPSQIRRVHYVDFFTGVISGNCVYFDI